MAMDVDGVLTQGGITYSAEHGCREAKTFFVRDGPGIKAWHQAGGLSAIITGRSSPIVAYRAAELGIQHVIQGSHNKAEALVALLRDLNLPPEAACFIGDDIVDVGAMRLCGLAVAVADACPDARSVAHLITQAAGGRGAVREVTERLLRCQGKWIG
jgi:3-deoxy-D-manno-octulosonate 8-phosphate phosphatase (KDO 8-P phosphatase)